MDTKDAKKPRLLRHFTQRRSVADPVLESQPGLSTDVLGAVSIFPRSVNCGGCKSEVCNVKVAHLEGQNKTISYGRPFVSPDSSG